MTIAAASYALGAACGLLLSSVLFQHLGYWPVYVVGASISLLAVVYIGVRIRNVSTTQQGVTTPQCPVTTPEQHVTTPEQQVATPPKQVCFLATVVKAVKTLYNLYCMCTHRDCIIII